MNHIGRGLVPRQSAFKTQFEILYGTMSKTICCTVCDCREVTLSEGPGRLFGSYASSPRAADKEIPPDIKIPICKECGYWIVDKDLAWTLRDAEMQVLTTL